MGTVVGLFFSTRNSKDELVERHESKCCEVEKDNAEYRQSQFQF